MAEYDHHGNEIPSQKHSRADIYRLIYREAVPAPDEEPYRDGLGWDDPETGGRESLYRA